MKCDIVKLNAIPKLTVLQARDKLLGNLTCTPSLNELARAVGTNRNLLSKEFQILFGMSVFAWLREQRLQEANRLLRETDWSIQKISDTVGYTDSNYFSTGFKRRFGKSPHRYRKINDANQETNDANQGLSV